MKKLISNIRNAAAKAKAGAVNFIRDRKGDLATNTIGAIIVAVVIVGILVIAINTFFPTFFSEMFEAMKTKLSANW